jgi:hypothetical protein
MVEPLYAPPSCQTQADDVVDHTGAVPKPATASSSPSPWRCPPGAIPEPVLPSTRAVPEPTTPSSSLSPRCHCPHDVLEVTTPSNPCRPWARNAVVLPKPARQHCNFFCHFGPTNPDFDMLHCHIALIWYIVFVLLHYFDVIHCHIALICYITFNMSHCFDMLHCHIALICCITFDMLHCHIDLMLHCFCSTALFLYATLPHCFDMLHIAILLLFYYILIYMNAYYIAQWWRWAKRDECGNMDQHLCTIKISSSNYM